MYAQTKLYNNSRFSFRKQNYLRLDFESGAECIINRLMILHRLNAAHNSSPSREKRNLIFSLKPLLPSCPRNQTNRSLPYVPQGVQEVVAEQQAHSILGQQGSDRERGENRQIAGCTVARPRIFARQKGKYGSRVKIKY